MNPYKVSTMKEKDTNGKKSNPFTLPENYFEEFHRNLMQQLPAKENTKQTNEKQLRISRMRRWSYAATIALMLVTGAATLCQLGYYKITDAKAVAENNEIIETIFDNYTIDDYNVYCYLTDNYTNY